MGIETSGMSFERPDPKNDTMEESKAKRLAELLVGAGSGEDRDTGCDGGKAQKCRAYAFLANRYAEDNAIAIQKPLVPTNEQSARDESIEEVG
jgi:hypothetical protein